MLSVIGPLSRNTTASERELGNVSMVSASSLIPITLDWVRGDFDYKTVKTACRLLTERVDRPGCGSRETPTGTSDVQQRCNSKETGAETSRMNRLSY